MQAMRHDPEPVGEDDTCDVDPFPGPTPEQLAERAAVNERSAFVDLTARMANDLAAFGRFVADHPELPVPHQTAVGHYGDDGVQGGVRAVFAIYVWDHRGEDVPAELARIARILNDGAGKGGVAKVQTDDYFTLQRRFGSVLLEVTAERRTVCEYVVTGTETVEMPDPEALAAVPTVTVERETGEWRCSPLLDASRPGPAMARAALDGAGTVDGTPAEVVADRMLGMSGVEKVSAVRP